MTKGSLKKFLLLAISSALVVSVPTTYSALAVAAPDAPGYAANSIKLIVDNDYVAFYGDDTNVTRLMNQNNVDWQTQISNASSITISPANGETYVYVGVMGGNGVEDFGGRLGGQDIVFVPGAQVASGRSPLGTAVVSGPYVKLETLISGYSTAAAAAGTQNVTLAQMQTALTGVTWGSAVGGASTTGTGTVPNWKTTGVCCNTSAATTAGLSGNGWAFPSDSLVVFRYPLSALGVPVTPGNTQVIVDWVPPAGGTALDNYVVEYKKSSDPDSSYSVFSRPIAGITMDTVTGLINGIQYSFRVASQNSGGLSPYTTVQTATPFGGTVAAPTISANVRKGVATTLTINQSFSGKVRFYVDNKKIAGCLNVTATGSSPNFTATCTYKPSWSGRVAFKAYITSTDVGYSSTFSNTIYVQVGRRSTYR